MKTNESRIHIGIFGRRNFGKSSLINALTGQETAIVSAIAGTTTDPVKKSIEIFGLGPVVLMDTAGIDDIGELGRSRIDKSIEALKQVDLALLVTNRYAWDAPEKELVKEFEKWGTAFLIVNNKIDELSEKQDSIHQHKVINVSTKTGEGMETLLAEMRLQIAKENNAMPALLEGLITKSDTVVLVTPIDSEAPAGRLILPQVQTIRAILDEQAVAVVLPIDELGNYLQRNPAPRLVITDSQIFEKVSAVVPNQIPLTSFSILLARQKGDFGNYLKGTPAIAELQDGDSILILESCTHQTSCEDIGRIKIPQLLQRHTGRKLNFVFVAGLDRVPDLSAFAMVVQCGGCMVTRKQLLNRLKPAIDAGIPVTNYGMLLAYVNGIFDRAVEGVRN